MLIQTVFITFCIALLVGVLLEITSKFFSSQVNTNPQFRQFQYNYFLVYFPVVFGDWLNAPYLYKLYAEYGFMEEQIAIIYVCGYTSSLIIGIGSSYFSKKYGGRKVFLAATVVYAIANIMKLSSDYSTLIISKIMSGLATALLFSAQESWYISMHTIHHDFPSEWIQYTLEISSKGNCAMAVFAGLIAYLMSEIYNFGPVAPSVLSAFVFFFPCLFAFLKWEDTKSSTSKITVYQSNNNVIPKPKNKFIKECCKGLSTIIQNSELLAIGLIQALYESVLCLFVFLWTPVLDHHNPPLGIVFASFMAGSFAAGALYPLVKSNSKTFTPAIVLLSLLLLSTATVVFCVISTEPTREFPIISFIAFFVFETISGLYFPAMRDVQHFVGLDKVDSVVSSWFRVPLNLLACLGLLFLHTSSNIKGTRNLFACCVVLVAIASAISGKFVFTLKHKKNPDELNQT